MRAMLRLAAPLTLTIALLFAARPADACVPPLPGFYATRPESGASLPLNAKIVLLGYDVGTAQVTVTQGDTDFVLTPDVQNGIITVDLGGLGLLGDITLYATSTQPGAMSVTANFVVTSTADTTRPDFKGVDSLSYEWFDEEPGLCQVGGFQVRAQITPATDDFGVIYYQLFEVLPNDALIFAGIAYHSDTGPLSIFAHPGVDEGTRCYLAIATDVAGNTAPQVTRGGTCIDLRREGVDAGSDDLGSADDSQVRFDAGAVDSGSRDTGVRADSGSGSLELDRDRGCGCSATPVEGASGLSLFVLILGLALSRSGRAARRTRAACSGCSPPRAASGSSPVRRSRS